MNAAAHDLYATDSERSTATGVMDAAERITNGDDTANTTARMRELCKIESDLTLEECKEVPLYDMTEDELAVVVLHDPDVNVRREALRMYRQNLLLDAQNRTFNLLGEMSKERRK